MTYKIIELEQGSTEWLALRKTKITATDTGVIMGLNPWKTPLMLWEEKLGLREPQAVNNKMREGSLLEEEARDFINKMEDNDFKPVVLQSIEHLFMMASLDGMNSTGDIMEIKCGEKSLHEAFRDEVPDYYYSQCQKQIFVSGCDSIYYFCYRSPEKRHNIKIRRDDAFIEKMIEVETAFYKCLMDFTPPPATDRDFVKRNDDLWNFHTREYKLAKSEKEKFQQNEDIHRNILISLCDGQSSQGGGVRISKTVSKGRVNYSNIKELEGVDLEKYRGKNITSYRFTETKEEG